MGNHSAADLSRYFLSNDISVFFHVKFHLFLVWIAWLCYLRSILRTYSLVVTVTPISVGIQRFRCLAYSYELAFASPGIVVVSAYHQATALTYVVINDASSNYLSQHPYTIYILVSDVVDSKHCYTVHTWARACEKTCQNNLSFTKIKRIIYHTGWKFFLLAAFTVCCYSLV